MTLRDALLEQRDRLTAQRAEVDLITARLEKLPDTFEELVEWLVHLRRYGNYTF